MYHKQYRTLLIISLLTFLTVTSDLSSNTQEDNSLLRFDEFITLEEHDKNLYSVTWSPDGTQLAYSDLSHIFIWNTNSQEVTNVFDNVGGFWTPKWSPDGHYLAAVSGDEVVLLNINEQETEHTFSDELLFQVQAIAWSPRGDYLAAGDSYGNIVIWDATTHLHYRTFSFGLLDSIQAISWSPNGQQLAIATGNYTAIYWNPHSQSEPTTLIGHEDIVNDVLWLFNGSSLASASGDGTLRLWNIKTQNTYEVLHHDYLIVSAISLSEDQYIATGGLLLDPNATSETHCCIVVWDIKNRTQITTPTFSNEVRRIDWNPHRNLLAFAGGDNRIHIWRAQMTDS